MNAERVTDSESVMRATFATRNARASRTSPAMLTRPWNIDRSGWSCRCGQSADSWRERHCVGCHTTGNPDDGAHEGCDWCGTCLAPPRRNRYGMASAGASYCSSSCRVYVSRWYRSEAGQRWERERRERREQAQAEEAKARPPRDWFEDQFATMFGTFSLGRYGEPPDNVPLRILGLSEKPSSQDAVKSAFRKALMQTHPDLDKYAPFGPNAALEGVLSKEIAVQELVWARDVLYQKIPLPPQPGEAAIETPKPRTEEERRARRERESRSRHTGEVCGQCGHEFAADEVACLVKRWGSRRMVYCADCTEVNTYKPLPCRGCDRPIAAMTRFLRYVRGGGYEVVCSERCAGRLAGSRRRMRLLADREPIDCTICGERIDTRRRDVRYCSSACRQRAFRQRRAAA